MIFSDRPSIFIKHYFNSASYPYVWALDRIIQCEVLNNSNADFGFLSNYFLDLEHFNVISMNKDYTVDIIDDGDYSRDAEKYELSKSGPKKNKIIMYISCGEHIITLHNYQNKYIKQRERMSKYEM